MGWWRSVWFSKLTHVVPIDGKRAVHFLLALNLLFSEVGLPTRLYVDTDSALIKVHREMIVSTSEATLREHGIGIEAVSAHCHSAHGLVERRMKDFGLTMGTLDKTDSGLSKIEISNIMRVVCGKLNNAKFEEVFLQCGEESAGIACRKDNSN